MTTEELLDLVRAGYTKEEILALDEMGKQPDQSEPEQGESEQGEQEQPAIPDVTAAIAEALKPINEQIVKLTALVQSSNRAAARTQPVQEATVESIVADFFGKPSKGGGN